MKLILNSPTIHFQYPVGSYIGSNLSTAIDMAANLSRQVENSKSIAFWVRGSSGAIISALLASKLESKSFINHIKKEGESSHQESCNIITDADVNIVVDDFTSSGNTLKEILKYMVENNTAPDIICMGGTFGNTLYYNTVGECLTSEQRDNLTLMFNEYSTDVKERNNSSREREI